METLWSMSTTIREAERIPDFIRTAKEIDGEKWTKQTQEKFQILLIKNRQYLNSGKTQDFKKLSDEQISILKDKNRVMTYEEAANIFYSKDYESPDMRGRQSMSPLVKLGLVDKSSGYIRLTDAGLKLADNKISLEEFMFDSLLKIQYPNPIESEHADWNTKPFINTLRLIKRVNEICREKGIKEKGITKLEFGIFALSLRSHNHIEEVANKIIEFRSNYESYNEYADKENYAINYINEYLSDFKNPVKNVKEYTDNMIRYMRITKYIHIRGAFGNSCIDLEPRRMIEIESLLENDKGISKYYTEEEWIKYFGEYGSYKLPFETTGKLIEILNDIQRDINQLESKLGMKLTTIKHCNEIKMLKNQISEQREYRTRLQNLEIKFDYRNDLSKINEAINSLKNIRKLELKPSIALEKWVNIALNIINDSKLIKPNSIVGDDNEPTFTAPAGVPDIECYYDSFNATCEVTMLSGRDQWFNEGQPIMRHLREFEELNKDKPAYCLFIAPSLHEDSIETFFTSVKYGYKGSLQKIVPITISQLIEILTIVERMKINGKILKHIDLMRLFNSCTSLEQCGSDSTLWLPHIKKEISSWKKEMLA